jgi:hypothetical protein
MGRGVRTVQRYERDLRLPVHRPAGKSRSAVIAFADEIDQWMRKGPLRAGTSGNGVKHVRGDFAEWKRLMTNTELLLERANALKSQMSHLARLIEETEKRRKIMLARSRSGPANLSPAVAQKTAALRSKMEEISELITRGGAKRET